MRRTTSRPGICSVRFLAANAVKGISATSAREIQPPVASSNTASGYSMGSTPSSAIAAIAALTWGFIRTVTDTSAPARIAAPTAAAP